MGAHCAPLRKKKSSAVLLFEAVAALRFSPDYSKGKGVIHKRVETLVSTLLCPCRAGKISFASQALNHRLAETNKQY